MTESAALQTVRWGMIGCGSVCEVKSGPGFYKAERSALVAVASRRPEHARDYAARHGVPRVYDSPEALVGDPGRRRRVHCDAARLAPGARAARRARRQARLRREADGALARRVRRR